MATGAGQPGGTAVARGWHPLPRVPRWRGLCTDARLGRGRRRLSVLPALSRTDLRRPAAVGRQHPLDLRGMAG
ncbi:hypothetical protein G6F57_016295 [Rhizopus arrhizus]|nr:hypothetical protein G6F63_016945 [Rhizopus arrhizus]KAG1433706.1 hypothetical protein G6F55_014664 [Rhizopus delemar]KAG1450905.1 hypothetical protein G6F57_016295 [Rhizopus arrhizus]